MYDLVIIGAGPAGLTASIYASCFHLKHLVIGAVPGGQMINAPDILNYPGFSNISGKELTAKMVEHAKSRGGELITGSVMRINQLSNYPINTNKPIYINNETMKQFNNDKYFEIETQSGKKYQAKAIILATGTERRKLNIPGEVEYTGRGVHYCATCERMEYNGKICAVVGGGNSAVQAAVELSDAAKKVYIIYRGTELRGESVWLDRIKRSRNIEVIYSTVVSEIVGNKEKLIGVQLHSSSIPNFSDTLPSGNHNSNVPISTAFEKHSPIERGRSSKSVSSDDLNNRILPIDKIFIEIGGVPGSALIIPLGIKINREGYIEVNEKLGTNVPGIFACGDLVSSGLSIEQIATAVGLGARAAASAFAYIKGEKTPIVWGKSQIKR